METVNVIPVCHIPALVIYYDYYGILWSEIMSVGLLGALSAFEMKGGTFFLLGKHLRKSPCCRRTLLQSSSSTISFLMTTQSSTFAHSFKYVALFVFNWPLKLPTILRPINSFIHTVNRGIKGPLSQPITKVRISPILRHLWSAHSGVAPWKMKVPQWKDCLSLL